MKCLLDLVSESKKISSVNFNIISGSVDDEVTKELVAQGVVDIL